MQKRKQTKLWYFNDVDEEGEVEKELGEQRANEIRLHVRKSQSNVPPVWLIGCDTKLELVLRTTWIQALECDSTRRQNNEDNRRYV